MSDNIKNSFEVWKEKNSDCFVLGTLGNSKYLENRLWHAYHGGLNERQAEVESLTKERDESRENYESLMRSSLVVGEEYRENINALQKELEALREGNRWIPVSERLPKCDERVWCWNGSRFFEGFVEHIIEGSNFRSASWVECDYSPNTPTHWRPLPSVPK